MTQKKIFEIALRQSADDCNCRPEDFLKTVPVVTLSVKNERARKYLPLPLACDMVSYGNNIVAQSGKDLQEPIRAFLQKYPPEHCFETPHLHALEAILEPFGLKICYMAEYFLPELSRLKELPCPYELRVLHQEDFAELYLPEWSNALCEKRRELDVMGVGAYHGEKLIGLAGCSADCAEMYQIGVDVLPEYRRQGVASSLTSRLAIEILKLGKVPFYCAAWCNIKSVGNAVKCGFFPAWAELTARSSDYVDALNQ